MTEIVHENETRTISGEEFMALNKLSHRLEVGHLNIVLDHACLWCKGTGKTPFPTDWPYPNPDPQPFMTCPTCNGAGRHLTQAGKTLLSFMKFWEGKVT